MFGIYCEWREAVTTTVVAHDKPLEVEADASCFYFHLGRRFLADAAKPILSKN